jgi:hypothetical protein
MLAYAPKLRRGQLCGVPLRFGIKGPVRSSTWMNTASHRKDVPHNYHIKVFSTGLCIMRIEVYEEKMENDLKP